MAIHAKTGRKAKAIHDHEKAIEKLLAKSRAVLAKADTAKRPVNTLPDLKAGRRGLPASDTIPAGGGYAKDIFYAYKWKQGKEERTDTILEMEKRHKKLRYSSRKEGKNFGFSPPK